VKPGIIAFIASALGLGMRKTLMASQVGAAGALAALDCAPASLAGAWDAVVLVELLEQAANARPATARPAIAAMLRRVIVMQNSFRPAWGWMVDVARLVRTIDEVR